MKNGMTTTEAVNRFLTAAHQLFGEKVGPEEAVFSADGKILPSFAVAAANGLMPAFIWHAESYHQYLTNTSMCPVFMEDRDALLGYTVSVDDCSQSLSELFLYVMEALQDVWEASPTLPNELRDITGFLSRFREEMSRRQASLNAEAVKAGADMSA